MLLSGVERICDGDLQDEVSVREAMAAAREGLNDQLESFAENTMTYLLRERELLLDGIGVPDVRTEFEGRHALIVVRGYHYKEDIQILRHYIREYRPILIGVDGGADAPHRGQAPTRHDRRRHGLCVGQRPHQWRRDRRPRLP